MSRCLLHQTKLQAFVDWCASKGIASRPGKGPYQVVQVETRAHGWQVIFRTDANPEHFTINRTLMPLVKQFIGESKCATPPLARRTTTNRQQTCSQP